MTGHDAENTGHDAENTGHDAENTGHALPKYALDSDAAPEASSRYSIRSIPTLIMFQRGIEVARVSGALSTAQLVSWVQQQLGLGTA